MNWPRSQAGIALVLALVILPMLGVIIGNGGCGNDQGNQADPQVTALPVTRQEMSSCIPDSFYVRVDSLVERLEANPDSITAAQSMAALRILLHAYETNVRNGWTTPGIVGREMVLCFRWRLERMNDLHLFHGVPVDQATYDDLTKRYDTMVGTYIP